MTQPTGPCPHCKHSLEWHEPVEPGGKEIICLNPPNYDCQCNGKKPRKTTKRKEGDDE